MGMDVLLCSPLSATWLPNPSIRSSTDSSQDLPTPISHRCKRLLRSSSRGSVEASPRRNSSERRSDSNSPPTPWTKTLPSKKKEISTVKRGSKLNDKYYPGDLKFDPLGLKPTDAADFETMQNKELNNGRLAMIASMGMIVQEQITHHTLF